MVLVVVLVTCNDGSDVGIVVMLMLVMDVVRVANVLVVGGLY